MTVKMKETVKITVKMTVKITVKMTDNVVSDSENDSENDWQCMKLKMTVTVNVVSDTLSLSFPIKFEWVKWLTKHCQPAKKKKMTDNSLSVIFTFQKPKIFRGKWRALSRKMTALAENDCSLSRKNLSGLWERLLMACTPLDAVPIYRSFPAKNVYN